MLCTCSFLFWSFCLERRWKNVVRCYELDNMCNCILNDLTKNIPSAIIKG